VDCINLFEFPDGAMLVQRIDHWHPVLGDLWFIDTTIQVTPVLHRQVRERYATEQERDVIYRGINHWTAFSRFRDMYRDLLNPPA
jgi:hypothetical protein